LNNINFDSVSDLYNRKLFHKRTRRGMDVSSILEDDFYGLSCKFNNLNFANVLDTPNFCASTMLGSIWQLINTFISHLLYE